MLDGARISALVVGGGAVAARRVEGLAAAGARVHVVAPAVDDAIEALAAASPPPVRVSRRAYTAQDVDGVTLVVAATNDPTVNDAVARDAIARGVLVNVVDAPECGTYVTPAVHRAGDVVVAVSAGGVPAAAARIRDRIAATIDARYADAVRELAGAREDLLGRGERARWREASRALVDADFCTRVESGRLFDELAPWR
jgi:precorrin-2 dehydrogenase/sirohydrochlorin ferrochelatase